MNLNPDFFHRAVEATPQKRRHFQLQRLPDGICKVRLVRLWGFLYTDVKYKINGHFATEFADAQAARDFIDNGWADKAVEDGWL